MIGWRRSHPRIAILVRYPRATDADLPFADDVGADRAVALLDRLARTTLRAVLTLHSHKEAIAVVRCDTAFLRAAREWLGPGPHYRYLGDHGRGDAVRRALGEGFSAKAKAVLVVGTESPSISAGLLRDALAALGAHDVVIGPGSDGRCWLVGARRDARGPALTAALAAAPWGEADEADALEDLCRSEGLAVARLPELPRPGAGRDAAAVQQALAHVEAATPTP